MLPHQSRDVGELHVIAFLRPSRGMTLRSMTVWQVRSHITVSRGQILTCQIKQIDRAH